MSKVFVNKYFLFPIESEIEHTPYWDASDIDIFQSFPV